MRKVIQNMCGDAPASEHDWSDLRNLSGTNYRYRRLPGQGRKWPLIRRLIQEGCHMAGVFQLYQDKFCNGVLDVTFFCKFKVQGCFSSNQLTAALR